MYVDAVQAMYQDYATVSRDETRGSYLSIMRQLRAKYLDDINASLFYGLGLIWTADQASGDHINGEKQSRSSYPSFKNPSNPGAAHYIIHAADTAELASEALPAARKYAAIAPDSPHALHMPSHIFNRLGLRQDSVLTNEASARVATTWIKERRAETFDEFHALNNIEYADLELGEYKRAENVMEQIRTLAVKGGDPWLPIEYSRSRLHCWL